MPNNRDIVPARPAQRPTIPGLLLDIRHDRPFRHTPQRQHIPDRQGRILPSIDELTRVHALVRDEGLGPVLEFVGVAEDDFGERGAAAGVVDDLLDDATDVAVAFAVVEGAELGGCLVEAGMGRCMELGTGSMWRMRLVDALKMDPRPFRWLRITRPILKRL